MTRPMPQLRRTPAPAPEPAAPTGRPAYQKFDVVARKSSIDGANQDKHRQRVQRVS